MRPDPSFEFLAVLRMEDYGPCDAWHAPEITCLNKYIQLFMRHYTSVLFVRGVLGIVTQR